MKNKAIIVYLENSTNYIKEYNWLRYCLLHNNIKDIDLVVFADEKTLNHVHDDCVKVSVKTPVSNSYNYAFLKSVEFFSLPEHEILYNYKYLIRSDTDVFITSSFPKFDCKDNFYCGAGFYSNSEEIRKNIKKTSEKFGLNYHGITNTGSTWFGTTQDVINVGRLTFDINVYLLDKYFKSREHNWPDWTYGVSLLYASEIALNHFVGNKLIIDHSKLDSYSTLKTETSNSYHIHCWHTNDQFSKFYFYSNLYDNIDIDSLDLNIVKDYCTYIAIKSKSEIKEI